MHRNPDEELPDGDELAVLVSRACAGDASAFERLYVRHRGLVRGVVVLEGCERSLVDDVVQEVFSIAWQRLVSLREAERFRPWLLQIARRTLIDHARKSLRSPRLLADTSALASLACVAPSPEDCAEATDLADRIERLVASMTARDAALLQQAVDRHCGRVSAGNPAEFTGSASKVALHRARLRLADHLAATA